MHWSCLFVKGLPKYGYRCRWSGPTHWPTGPNLYFGVVRVVGWPITFQVQQLCRTACSSHCDQKTDLIEETRQYIDTSTIPSRVASSGLNMDQKWAAIFLFYIAPTRPWTQDLLVLIPCRTTCSSQCDQKTDLMEETRKYIYTSTNGNTVKALGSNHTADAHLLSTWLRHRTAAGANEAAGSCGIAHSRGAHSHLGVEPGPLAGVSMLLHFLFACLQVALAAGAR
jgi:hypothetical protein